MLELKRVLTAFMILSLISGAVAAADVDFGASIKDGKLDGFYLAISEQYDVSQKEIKHVRAARMSDEELPVVFYLARKANTRPSDIIMLRLKGYTWMEITLQFGLNADIYYVAFDKKPGPPYGNAYGHFHKHKRKDWGEIRLNDDEIVNMVNLRFLSDHYRRSPDEVAAMRAKGQNFVDINSTIKKAKNKKEKAVAESNSNGKSQGNGKGKSKKK